MTKMNKILVYLLEFLKHLRSIYLPLLRSLSDLYHLMFMMYDKGDLHIHDNFLPKDLNNLLIYIT
ncbi:hypothetical protein IEQ34_007696 [Dendrobium chrysotoxum]|uniref:Uncharacterized protein n=1 Tax=Dendrobium chrysotoxum TaxID=161865 RepID=A0AAV7H5N5_DENCH|nr:hypothetical protein IEQ34_007696 [Dendrobium chrysotoxum]